MRWLRRVFIFKVNKVRFSGVYIAKNTVLRVGVHAFIGVAAHPQSYRKKLALCKFFSHLFVKFNKSYLHSHNEVE